MKNIKILLGMLAFVCMAVACNNEWEEEQYIQYASLKAPINSNGVTRIYVRYKADEPVIYRLPVIISGSTDNAKDRDVVVAVDPDTLQQLNIKNFANRTDLYFDQMEDDKYSFPEVVHIPAGQNVGLLDINFNLKGIDMNRHWVLPLGILDDPSYNYVSHPRKHYAKALLRVIPFNDYSGSYNAAAMTVYSYIYKNGEYVLDTNARTTDSRTGYVVDDKTVFFYAGLINEDLHKDVRKYYKINVHFKDDGTVDMTPADPDNRMKFNLIGEPIYSKRSTMDATRPYLERRYVQLMFSYDFEDFSYHGDFYKDGSTTDVDITKVENYAPLKYHVEGTLTLQRNINTQIPDEDQQIEW